MTPVQDGKATDAAWLEVGGALHKSRLAFDYREILQAAIERLRGKVEYTSLPAFLLPEPKDVPSMEGLGVTGQSALQVLGMKTCVCLAMRASIRGPSSSLSWKANTKSGQPSRESVRWEPV